MEIPYAEVIGDPVAHSKSPLIHRHWLRELGIAGDYLATRVEAKVLARFLSERRSDRCWRGCNVTIPYKEVILPLLDRVDERAARAGAVNCVISTPEGLVGFNTDIDGIAAALDGIVLEGRKVAIIGAGGAARASLAYLAERNGREVVLLVRNPAKAEPLESVFPGRLGIGRFDEAAHLLQNAAAIINASPLGMTGCAVMPVELLAAVAAQPGATLFDMVYSPAETAFLLAGTGRAIDGLTMLVGQAATAFQLFFGKPPPSPDHALQQLLTSAGTDQGASDS